MKTTVHLLTAAWTLVAVAALAGEIVPPEELENDHALTCEFAAPHTDWARPYALGKTRVLFFTSGTGMAPRECVELIERFDIDGKAAFAFLAPDGSHDLASIPCWHGGPVGERRIMTLLREKWDCFAFFGIPIERLPPEAQRLMLKAVADGAGLVLLGTDDARVLKAKNRLRKAPGMLMPGPIGEAYSVGRGRGVRIAQRPYIPYREGWQVEDDYWHEQLGRAMLWAAGREPTLRVVARVSKPECDRAGPNPTLTLQITGKPRGENFTLDVRVRRPADEAIALPAGAASVGATLQLAIPKLPPGDYRADVRALSSAGVETWTTVPLRVTAARSVAAIKLAKDWGEIGEHIAGTAILTGPAAVDEIVRIRLMDRRRREIVRHDMKANGDKAAFDFAIEPWMPMLTTVEAQVIDAAGEVARRSEYFHVVKRNRGQFNFVVWGCPTGTLAPYAEESLARWGMTVQLQSQGAPKPPLYMAALDIASIPYTTWLGGNNKTPDGVMTPFCWNDEAAVQKCVADLAAQHHVTRQHGVFVYSLGDENQSLGCCLSPHCARAYRAYLKESYGGLDALNRSWGTAMKTWDEVGLSDPKDNEEDNSLQRKNYPRWFDRQAFKSYNYVKYCQKYVRAFAAIDPQAKTGFEGSGSISNGDDVDLFLRDVTFWAPYPGTADEISRSIAPREMPRGNWMGYVKDPAALLSQYWRMVVRNEDVWWWMWENIGMYHGWLAPNFYVQPEVKQVLEDTQIVRDGLGDLLRRATPRDAGIVFLHSYPSIFACRLPEEGGFGGYEMAHTQLFDAIRDLGLQFRYATDRMLRQGEFDLTKYKVLVLPRVAAISDKEAQIIRDFVEQGGTVIADIRPGLYTEHCKPRLRGVLNDLFGVACDGKAAPKTGKFVAGEKSPVRVQFPGATVDRSVAIVGPKAVNLAAVDGAPAMIVNPVGKGRAVLLNFYGGNLPRIMARETPEAIADLLESLLAPAGVAPEVVADDDAGNRVRCLETFRWQNGGDEIVALVPLLPCADRQEATIRLKGMGRKYVFDLRSHKLLGRTDKVVVVLRRARPTFLLLAAQAAPTPQLALDRAAVQRGSVVRATISVPSADSLHAFRIRVRVGNRKLEWLNRNVIVGQEPKTFEIPVAYNDPVGDYEIAAIDLITDRPTTTVLRVGREPE